MDIKNSNLEKTENKFRKLSKTKKENKPMSTKKFSEEAKKILKS